MILKIKVNPNSGREEISKVSEGEYKVCLKKPAENDKANIELEKLLKKYFKSEVKILRGKTSKNKIVEVKN